jgi:hypothetical protein
LGVFSVAAVPANHVRAASLKTVSLAPHNRSVVGSGLGLAARRTQGT